MNVALKKEWTVESFLAWVVHQEGRYEFDGAQPVAMTGGNRRHNRITLNLYACLEMRLVGSAWSCYGPDLGIRTIGRKIRSPDALITRASFSDEDLVAPDPVVVFEVLSPSSGPQDRVVKVEEYAATRSILRYVIIDCDAKELVVRHRAAGDEPWRERTLAADDMLTLPEVGIEFLVSELYRGVSISAAR
jgi:Uma2 family endonuclease